MVGTLILTHGGLARELLAAARVIAGTLPAFEALSLPWEATPEQVRGGIAEAVARLDDGDGVIILTDIYGGTPNNLALSLARPGSVEVVTGVNLPMVVRLGCRTGGGCEHMAVTELAVWLRDKGRTSVQMNRQCQSGVQCGCPPADDGGEPR